MIQISHRHSFPRVALAVVAVSILLLPIAYVAGLLTEMGQVRPVLTKLDQARQTLVQQQASIPTEPPAARPSQMHLSWGAQDVTLSWAKVPGASSYTIYRSSASGSFQQAVQVGQVIQSSSVIVFVDGTVSPDTSYTYWIAPDNAAGQGPMTPAVSGRTYLTWNQVLDAGTSAAVSADATAWSQSAWGLLPPHSSATSPTVWKIGTKFYTAFSFPASAQTSTWLTKRWTTWTAGNQTMTFVHAINGISVLAGGPQDMSSLPIATATPEDLALWQNGLQWDHEIVAANDPVLPQDAIVLNRYGQAVGLTTVQGHLVTLE